MKYLDWFSLLTLKQEDAFLLGFSPKMTMQCYSDNAYPYRIFPQKQLSSLSFEPVTMLYGGNGSGKTTLLNIIAEKLSLKRSSPFYNTPFYENYLMECDFGLSLECHEYIPKNSRIVTSDDVFDFLLNIREINNGIDNRREYLFSQYDSYKKEEFTLRTLDDYEALKIRNQAKTGTKSQYVSQRLPMNLTGKSNGESAYNYFTDIITNDALYLLDEPENSLSPALQIKLRDYILEASRFFNCQFIISTHSPFLLSMKGCKIYDLDTVPVNTKRWYELENVRLIFDFFNQSRDLFE